MPSDKWHVPALLPYIYKVENKVEKKIKELLVNRALLGQSSQNMIQRTFCHGQNYKSIVQRDISLN